MTVPRRYAVVLPAYLAALLAIGAAGVLVGLAWFRRRDIQGV